MKETNEVYILNSKPIIYDLAVHSKMTMAEIGLYSTILEMFNKGITVEELHEMIPVNTKEELKNELEKLEIQGFLQKK